jgi:hypothetical protein
VPTAQRLPRRLGLLLIAAGSVLVPWLLYLAGTDAAGWSALDALESAGLVTTGVLLRRNAPHTPPAALATAALLLMDALLDITTATTTSDLTTAIAMALLAELPTATICTLIALQPPGTRDRNTVRLRRGARPPGARGTARPALHSPAA